MKKYLLSIDNGGTYIKAALFDTKGNQLNLVKHSNDVITLHENYSEYNQDELWETNCYCMREVIKESGIKPEQIACIGFCGQGSGFYAVDAQGRNIRNAITSSDRRAQEQTDKWHHEGLSDQVYPYIFRYPLSGHMCAILSWLKENEVENYQRIRWLFSMKDFLIYRLTGNIVASYDCLSTCGILNLKNLSFDKELSDMFGLPGVEKKFGKLQWGSELCGKVTEQAANLCGCAPETPVSVGLHDVNAAALAMGAKDIESSFIITGTHAINGYISPTPVLNKTIKNNELFAAYPGMFLIEEGYPASAATLEWVIDVLFGEEKKNSRIYKEIDNMVEKISPTDQTPIFLPFLRGYRNNPYARCSWVGLNSSHNKAHMLCAVYEGVAFSHMIQLEYLFQECKRPSKIMIAGGATNSKIWMQIFADAIDLPLEIISSGEVGAKGTAILSTVASGIYPDIQTAVDKMKEPGVLIYPRKKFASIYKQKYEKFKLIVQNLDLIWTK